VKLATIPKNLTWCY